MSRTYDAQSLVDLPILDAQSALTLGTALATAGADEKKLAPNVAQSLQRVTAAGAGVQSVLVQGLKPERESGLGAAVRSEAGIWAALESLLKGLGSVPGTPQAPVAAKLHGLLFADGLRFVRAAASRRWSETETRLQLIEQGHVAELETIGAKHLLAALHTAHKATGAAAGITASKGQPEPSQVGVKSDALKAAIRCYVLQVAANAAMDETGAAAALADRLLAPLANYVAPSAGKPAVAVPVAADAGAGASPAA